MTKKMAILTKVLYFTKMQISLFCSKHKTVLITKTNYFTWYSSIYKLKHRTLYFFNKFSDYVLLTIKIAKPGRQYGGLVKFYVAEEDAVIFLWLNF